MPVFRKGSFELNLGIVKLGGDLDEEDRQFAWQFYCEIVSRVAIRGKLDGKGEDVFTGEVLVESLASVYNFFREARATMKAYPVGKLGKQEEHLGFAIAKMLELVVRPFLEKWQATLRHWWENNYDGSQNPFELQESFPGLEALQKDWIEVRKFSRAMATELANTHQLVDLLDIVPPDARQCLVNEMAGVVVQSEAAK